MDIHWRNTQKPARFFAVDARAFFAIFLFLVHARLWTFMFACVIMAFFWILERRGLTFEAACRSFRSWILGRNRPANLGRYKRHWIDFG
ncbi:MAG: IcmT/TraK family protein [Alphaproteobacteria bacterium]|nr:IcmT/TraK family protein [Alphaproteobacteria bacterium]